MEWADYLATLTDLDRSAAEALATKFGAEATARRVRFYPVHSVAALEEMLERERKRVVERKVGLFESIPTQGDPEGWTFADDPRDDGTAIHTDVTGPNGAVGWFDRAYNAPHREVEFREAFLKAPGSPAGLPRWINGCGVPLDSKQGTPTVHLVSIRQLKLLGVPAGHGDAPEKVKSFRIKTVENVETILHLHWLRQRFPAANLNELVALTASVDYTRTCIEQCGYRVDTIKYDAGEEYEEAIGELLKEDDVIAKPVNDAILLRYGFVRETVMWRNFDIVITVYPELAG